MIAVGNRVLLRRVDYSLFGHVDLGFFVAAALEPGVFTGSSEHGAHGDALLALCLLLDGVKEDRFHPCRNCCIRIGDFSAKVKGPKVGRWHFCGFLWYVQLAGRILPSKRIS